MCLFVKALLWQKYSSLPHSFGGDLHFPLIHIVPISGIKSDKTLDLCINSLIPWQDTTAEKSSFLSSDCILEHKLTVLAFRMTILLS